MPLELGIFDSKKKIDSPIERYAINLMWLNRTKDNTQTYIGPSRSEEELAKKLLAPAIKWSIANPEGRVNLWYDSIYTTSEAVENTQRVLSKLLAENNIRNLQLRDIRDIAIVAKNPDVFSVQTPLYFRIDLLKAIIVIDSIESEGNDAAIFSDLEVGNLRPNHDRMTKDTLFSPQILKRLDEAGLILNGTSSGPENQFLQLGRNQEMIDAIKQIVINANLTRAIIRLNRVRAGTTEPEGEKIISGLNQLVYLSMISQLYPYYYAKKSESIPIRIRDGGLPADLEYDIDQHGYGPLGLDLINSVDFPSQTRLYYPEKHESEVNQHVDFCVSRHDLDVRGSHSHPYGDIVKGSPASGDMYQCTLLEVTPSTTVSLGPK
jgi:hypothetical protein